MTCKPAIAALALITLSGCAAPAVDRETAGFDAAKFSNDLEICRGGTAFKVTLDGLAGAVYGSAIGAADGTFYGAIAGDAPEGVIIGAIAGSVIGVVMGAYEPFDKQAESVRRCLSGKGYVLGL